MTARTAPTATLTDLLGAPVAELTAQDIERLVEQQVRESDELDFKAKLYGKDEDAKVELCKDIAGLRNHRGGVILLGVGEKAAVANGRLEVELSDAEERRMRQIVASGTAPHASFEIRAIPGDTAGRGFYLLLAEPSPFRPHAVLVDDGLRYPRRNGTATRYLTEAEVADMYRDRFRGEKQQIERLAQITEETLPMLNTSDDRTWLVVSMVPNNPGDLPISFNGLLEIEAWARAAPAANEILDAFFAELPATASVGVERYILTSPADEHKPATYPYAVCFTDGAALTAVTVRKNEGGPQVNQDTVVLAAHLVICAASSLRFAGRHAARAGARGDAVVHARVFEVARWAEQRDVPTTAEQITYRR